MPKRLPRRSWSPAREAPVLLAVQLVTLWQAALRGLDPAAVGVLVLLLGAVVVLVGVAGRWASAVIAGHALIGSWYLGLGWVALDSSVTPHPAAALGVALSAAGVAVLVHPHARTWARLGVAVPAMVGGLLVLAGALGTDYRAGTGLVSAGLLHLTLAAGTFLLWQRRRLAEVVERERAGVARE